MFNDLGRQIDGSHRVVYDRENWYGYWRGEYGQRDVKRLRLQDGPTYDVTGHRYVRVDKFACTVEASDSPDGPWELCPLAGP